MQRDSAAAARRLRQAGHDAVGSHAANGYLSHRFPPPRTNGRANDRGVPIGNRARWLLETVQRMRDAPPDLPIRVRFPRTECRGDTTSVPCGGTLPWLR